MEAKKINTSDSHIKNAESIKALKILNDVSLVINDKGKTNGVFLNNNQFNRIKKLVDNYEKLLEEYEDKIDALEAKKILSKNKKTYSLAEVKKSLNL
jgi:hypothetical protein